MENNQGKSSIASLLNVAVGEVFWLQTNGEMTTLKDVMLRKGALENLSDEDLMGAFTSLQIKTQDFSKSAACREELVKEVKTMLFASVNKMVKVLEEGQKREKTA